jgi:hypothetical protein
MIHKRTHSQLSPAEAAQQGGRTPGDAERIEFIRRAAIAEYCRTLGVGETILVSEAWVRAKALWNAKPEDC